MSFKSVGVYDYYKYSFKITKILPIPESKLFLVVSEEFGFYFFNMTAMFIEDSPSTFMIGELNL